MSFKIFRVIFCWLSLFFTQFNVPFMTAAAQEEMRPPAKITQDERILIDNALRKLKAGKNAEAMTALRTLAEGGMGEAFFQLAEIYRLGLDGPAEINLAIMHYRLAAALDHQRASLSLANMLYFNEDRDEIDVFAAVGIWQQQAMLGNVEAMYVLGMLYWNGDAGLMSDPIRGYGLVWRAVQEGYADAFDSENKMLPLLTLEARRVGREYAENVAVRGFPEDPLAIDLVVSNMTPAAPGLILRDTPENWDDVWSLEVGFNMKRLEADTLLKTITLTEKDILEELASDVISSKTREGTFKVVFGPMENMQEAVSFCVKLKQADYDCFAKPPN